MVNLSFNSVNVYNSGQSGFRHKIALNSNELNSFLEHFTKNILNTGYDNEEERTDFLMENFDLGFFDLDLKIALPLPAYNDDLLPAYKLLNSAHYPELNSPPPKITRLKA